jgi:CRISPR-associated endonuclease Csn1
MIKKILGLDLGSASIGWALISENEDKSKCNDEVSILGMGSRIIPYEGTEGRDFSKGTGESRNALRTRARSIRRGYDRYQLRRKYLIETLTKNKMMPDKREVFLNKIELWELRSRAAEKEISLQEFGRILLHLNQKRGYKSSRSEANLDKKDTEFVAEVRNRHSRLNESGLTIGQFFYQQLRKDEYFRIKENVFPREAYIEEFDKICTTQGKYHSVLTDDLIGLIRDKIIYYQRPLKSQKGLVSVCEFEGYPIEKGGRMIFVGPKVAPRSSPVFQLTKIWENINNIIITDKNGDEILIPAEKKRRLFEYLDNNEKLTKTDLLRILELKRDNCYVNKQIEKGIQGNLTKSLLKRYLGGQTEVENLLKFDMTIIRGNKECYIYDRKTGEIVNSKVVKFIDPSVEKEPLYKLWHTIYSIDDLDECSNTLQQKFHLEKELSDKLARLDFTKQGFGNKSVKAMRKILPYLMEGDCYSDAMSYAGYNHSDSFTSEQNLGRNLLVKIKPIPKNSLRQPVVEKILNQMVNVVNAIIEAHGKPDEIRIELARELKQSKAKKKELMLKEK